MRGGHLGHVNQMPRTNFPSPYPRKLHIKFDFGRATDFEKKMFEIVKEGRPDGRWTDAGP